MADSGLILVATRDSGGTLLWEREPRYIHGGRYYINGGNALPLPDDVFPSLATPGRIRVRLEPVEE